MNTTMNTARLVAIAALGFATLLTSATEASTLNGTVQTGGTRFVRPLRGAEVTLYEATESHPIPLGTATTDFNGQFVIDSPVDSTSSIFFATADINLGVRYVTIIGQDLLPEITINELTTIAASYSMAQFYRTGEIAGDGFTLQIAAGMNDNIVSPVTGESSEVLLTSPNADQSNSLRSTRSLANLLAASNDQFLVRILLFALTGAPGNIFSTDTSQAIASLARDPGQNVWLLYALTKYRNSYAPALFRAPDAWTVTVKVNDSGDDRFLFGGPANVAFAKDGHVWVANNVRQGTPNSSFHVMVLKPNGKPADGTNGTPTSPVSGGGVLGIGLGVTIDSRGDVWFGNFGWGDRKPSADGNGSVARFAADGTPVSGPLGYQGGPVRAQGLESDDDDNMWISSFGNDRIYVFPKGDPDSSVFFQEYKGAQPFDVAIAPDQSAWVTNSGGIAGEFPASVAKYVYEDGEIKRKFIRHVGKALKSVDVDSLGNAWVCSELDSTVYAFSPDGDPLGSFTRGGISGPWGVTIDGEDNVWIANFGPVGLGTDYTNGGITKLWGANPRTKPRGKRTGAPVSPRTGYTVPSAGSEVLMHDGTPLYGDRPIKSFAPIMRQTMVKIDRAGNIWSINNWKPNFRIDSIGMNPGGDGIVIFVGLAPPPPKPDN